MREDAVVAMHCNATHTYGIVDTTGSESLLGDENLTLSEEKKVIFGLIHGFLRTFYHFTPGQVKKLLEEGKVR